MFDQAPAPRKIGVVRRQGPDDVHVIGEDADCDCLERIALSGRRIDATKALDVPHEEIARPIGESHGEEEPSASIRTRRYRDMVEDYHFVPLISTLFFVCCAIFYTRARAPGQLS